VNPGNHPGKLVGLYTGMWDTALQKGAHRVRPFTPSKLVSTYFLHGEHAHRGTLQLTSSHLITFATGRTHQKDFTYAGRFVLTVKPCGFLPQVPFWNRVCVSEANSKCHLESDCACKPGWNITQLLYECPSDLK